MIQVDKAIKIAVKTGKVTIGSKKTVEDLKKGKPKLVIIASNCPDHVKSEIQYYSELAKIPVLIFTGNSWELGSLCDRLHMVAALAIHDPGDSDILDALAESTGVKAEAE